MNKYRTAAFIATGVAAISFLWSGSASAAEADCAHPTIVAVAGETTFGTDGRDVILGTQGPDQIFGGAGNDVICGLGGNDDLIGDDGADEIYAGDGDDNVWLVDRTDDFADGGAGHDTVTKDYDPQDRVVNFEEIAA